MGGIIGTEIAKDLGQEHKELQNKLNTFFKKHNSNNSNNRNNNRGSNNNNNPEPKLNTRVQATREDADKYRDGLKTIVRLQREPRAKHECYRITENCEYMGVKLKKNSYISRDTMHHEWEYFSRPDSHEGAIDPITGILNTGKKRSNRRLNVN